MFPGVPGSNLAADGQCERSPSEGDDLRGGCWPGESCGGVAGMEHVIGGKFKLGKKIGSGSFGELYLGTRLAGFLIESLTRLCGGFLRAAVLFCSSFYVCC